MCTRMIFEVAVSTGAGLASALPRGTHSTQLYAFLQDYCSGHILVNNFVESLPGAREGRSLPYMLHIKRISRSRDLSIEMCRLVHDGEAVITTLRVSGTTVSAVCSVSVSSLW